MDPREAFARRLRAGDPLTGTFVKSQDPATVEILGQAGFDCLILDAEHAPYDRGTLALMLMAARAAGIAALVRVPCEVPWIATALDAGAAGVMVPQVRDADHARALVRAMRFAPEGELGFSPSTAGAGYGARGIARHHAQQQKEAVLICQIEDPAAVENAGWIASVPGVDALLVGPVDLAVSAGETDPAAPAVQEMCRRVISAQGAATGLFLGQPSQAGQWREIGASLFILGTDQGFLMQAARGAVTAFRG
ncbi:HpcH/HpaI aldolase family protein [Maritimibacter alkaliphilus]|uniref:HpcH/HpaI aldolase family protein n=1 Tax=Maritimibacter alkaliphilus TaxID=404236 RepID=UPI001C972FFD|nr:aldolase/citrate lyase family protein [Maritimibacter alkaliphilus]MBY6091906.1 4-hydroxy-2-oxovalerate aldolase [Maritimibacter alkaliphilus]